MDWVIYLSYITYHIFPTLKDPTTDEKYKMTTEVHFIDIPLPYGFLCFAHFKFSWLISYLSYPIFPMYNCFTTVCRLISFIYFLCVDSRFPTPVNFNYLKHYWLYFRVLSHLFFELIISIYPYLTPLRLRYYSVLYLTNIKKIGFRSAVHFYLILDFLFIWIKGNIRGFHWLSLWIL